MIDNIIATGTLTILLLDKNGNIKDNRNIKNLVVTVGKNLIASRLANSDSSVISHMALGTSSIAAVSNNTTLGTEVDRVSLISSVLTNEVTYTAVFPGNGAFAIAEAGLFNAATDGTMLSHTVFGVVNKDIADSLTIIWKLSIN